MYTIDAHPGDFLAIGRAGEHKARRVRFDLTPWVDLYGQGVAQLLYRRPGDTTPYPVALERDEDTVIWVITSTDTAIAGRTGRAELRYYADDTLAKSEIYFVGVACALTAPGDVPDPPGQSWVDQALESREAAEQAAQEAEDAAERAEAAAAHQPYPDPDTGTWWVWDVDAGEYVDTGVHCGGASTELDETLKEEGKAADAKAVGDAIAIQGRFPESFGAKGDGVTDDAEAITKSFTASKNVVLDGTKTYAIGSTLVIPAGIHVDFNGASIVPMGNHDVIRVSPGAHVENLVVRCTDVEGWDSAAVVLYGGDFFSATNQTKITNAKLYNDTDPADGTTTLGVGFKLYGDKLGDYIEGVTIEDAMTYGFGTGMLFAGVDDDLDNPTGGMVFIGANKFRGYWSYKDNLGINIASKYPNTHITNNFFTDLQIQPNFGKNHSSYGICCHGFTNYFEGCLYDYTNGHTAVCFGSGSNRNTVMLTDGEINTPDWYIDVGGAGNVVKNIDFDDKVIYPRTQGTHGVCGDQDDALAYIDKRADCTLESPDTEPYYGTLENVFDPVRNKVLVYRTEDPDINQVRAVITINCKAALKSISHFVLFFGSKNPPKAVKVTFYTDTKAVVGYNTKTNTNRAVFINPYHVTSRKNCEAQINMVAKIVVELGGCNYTYLGANGKTYGSWELHRIMAVDCGDTGYTWLKGNGGKIYGDLQFSSGHAPILFDTNGKRYLLTVATDGTLGTSALPDEEEENPEVATLTPVMAAGTAWYSDAVAGAAQSTITSISFDSSYEPTGNEDASWACDEDCNGNIMAYRNGTEVVIKSTTGSDGVELNRDSTYMFANDGTKANFAALTQITGTETWKAGKNTDITRMCSGNTALTSTISIPEGVVYMSYTFSDCTALTMPPELPEGLLSMSNILANCSEMKKLPEIPSTVTNLSYAFQGCVKAVEAPPVIPESVTNLTYTFRNCRMLEGTIEVNAVKLTAYEKCFDVTARDSDGIVLTGSCPVLDELAATNTIEKVTVGATTPSYVRAAADAAATKLRGLEGERTVTFACVSDAHVNCGLSYAAQTQESATHAGMAIERVASQVELDFVGNLGDNLWGENTDVDDAKKENQLLNQSISDAFEGHLNFRLVGNHDANLWDACIPTAEIYAMNGQYNQFDNTGATKIRGYGYNDLEQYKLRVIALNTSDYIDNKGGYALSDEQKLWLMRSLDLSDKSDAAQWSILILSHFPLDFPSSDYNTHEDVPAILTAYQKGTAVTIDAGNYDYAGKNAATIVANIHGHLHNFAVGTMEGSGITRVCTPNTCFYNNGASGTEADERYQPNEVYDKTADSAQDTTVTFYVVDLDNHVIHSVNYGAGYDREIAYNAEKPKASEPVADLAGAVRQAFYITEGAIDVQSDNLKLILGSSTDNGHGWATRESTTVYLIPVPAQANAVTVATTDSRWTKMGIALIQVNDGVYSSTNPGWLDIGTYAFTPGSVAYMAINLLSESDVPWGYDTTANITLTFEET